MSGDTHLSRFTLLMFSFATEYLEDYLEKVSVFLTAEGMNEEYYYLALPRTYSALPVTWQHVDNNSKPCSSVSIVKMSLWV